VVVEANGLSFVAEKRASPLIAGLRVDVESYGGREGLVAYRPGAFGGC
jgi:hypothetical protein